MWISIIFDTDPDQTFYLIQIRIRILPHTVVLHMFENLKIIVFYLEQCHRLHCFISK